MLWRALAVGFGVAMVLTIAAGVARVAWLEGREVHLATRATLAELATREGATDESARLGRVTLLRDQEVTFELCAAEPMRPERWAGSMAVAVWRPRARELMTRADLTPEVLANVRRDATSGCLLIGRGVIADDDVYAVDALFDSRPRAIEDVPLVLAVQARQPLETLDLAIVLSGWLFAILFVVALALRPREAALASASEGARASIPELDLWEQAQAQAAPKLIPEARVAIGLVLVVGAFVGSGFLPGGNALALATGVALAIFEASMGVALAPGASLRLRARVLALVRPPRPWLHFPIALASGVALYVAAIAATRLVPSTGESAIQTFVSWPSGLLSFACLAVVAPLAEEVFFRGFVYGVLEERSRVAAFLSGWLLFVLAHVPQTFGQWGALASICVTGLGLTTLRWTSRSTLVPALAHLVYNGLLAVVSVAG